MRSIKPEDVKAAMGKLNGWRLRPGVFFDGEYHAPACCALSAVALSEEEGGPDLLASRLAWREGFDLEAGCRLLGEKLDLPYDYAVDFVNGFDTETEQDRIDPELVVATPGFLDGLACRLQLLPEGRKSKNITAILAEVGRAVEANQAAKAAVL